MSFIYTEEEKLDMLADKVYLSLALECEEIYFKCVSEIYNRDSVTR